MECREYEEGAISFLPTYRYVNGGFDPDQSGWPDRIWFSGLSPITCQEYDVVSELRQEHVPVFGRYELQIKKIKDEVYEKIKR